MEVRYRITKQHGYWWVRKYRPQSVKWFFFVTPESWDIVGYEHTSFQDAKNAIAELEQEVKDSEEEIVWDSSLDAEASKALLDE